MSNPPALAGANVAASLEPLLVDLVARDAVKVPPYPGVAMRLQQLVAGGKFSLTDLARLIAEDQALTASVLRAANSALVRGIERVTSLSDAVARLGSEELCRIALASTVGQPAAADGALAELRRLAWRRSMTAALFCKVLAERRKANAQEAFVCGLLHDFGWVVALACVEELLPRLPAQPSLPQADWMALVQKFHLQLGALVAARWNLSPLLQAVMSTHHLPPAPGPFKSMLDLMATADAVVDLLEQHPTVTAAQLTSAPNLAYDEVRFLVLTLPQIPPVVAAMSDLAIGAPATAPAAKSQVARPSTTLKGLVKTADLPASWVRQGDALPVKVVGLGRDGLVFVTGEKPKENYLLKLKFEASAGGLELFVSPALAQPEGKAFRVEARLFALAGDAKDTWEKLYARHA